jgi:Tol biopolymer transport system component
VRALAFVRGLGRAGSVGRVGTLLVSLVALGVLALVPSAQAIYGPAGGGFGASIVSVDNASDEQANAPTTDADISGNGRYVVFQTKATNFFEDDGETQQEKEAAEPPGTEREGGIFRYDRETGRLEFVASGNLVLSEGKEAGKVLIRGAENPSVSAEGRYIVFSSAQQLVPDSQPDHTENVEVYERDMNVAPGQAGAYTLVSAQNGSETPAGYDDSLVTLSFPGGDPGAEVWPNTSVSANGQYVVFRSGELPSSLPESSMPTTPAGQLFVRDLQNRTTTLVTRTEAGDSPGPECGAAVSSTGGEPACGANGPASISADGSTVAWLGSHAPSQTVFLPNESLNEAVPYYLWQRWSESDARTRRITGIADPEDAECKSAEEVVEPGDPTATGPCYGPLTYPESSSQIGLNTQTPTLSSDGYMVAFLTGSSLRPNTLKADALDLFVTSMHSGVTRKAGTRELTLAVNGAQGNGTAPITSLAFSADGTHIVFVSQRSAFVLSEPFPVGSFSQSAQQSELYAIDLSTDTLERAILGVEGVEPNGSTLVNPTVSANGEDVAFVSSASNLVFGDANGVADAFVATLQSPTGTATSPASFNTVQGGFSLTGAASPELGLSVKRAANGDLIVLVETPGAGKLAAQATGTIVTKVGKKVHKKKVVFAHVAGVTHAEGTATLVLRLAARYAKDLQKAGKLKALVTVAYTPPPPAEALADEADATFLAGNAKKAAKGSPKVKSKARK